MRPPSNSNLNDGQKKKQLHPFMVCVSIWRSAIDVSQLNCFVRWLTPKPCFTKCIFIVISHENSNEMQYDCSDCGLFENICYVSG